MLINISNCSACQQDHQGVLFAELPEPKTLEEDPGFEYTHIALCPNKNLAVYMRVVNVGDAEDRLKEALEALKLLRRNECFCDVGIDNPLMRGKHSLACINARAVLSNPANEALLGG